MLKINISFIYVCVRLNNNIKLFYIVKIYFHSLIIILKTFSQLDSSDW